MRVISENGEQLGVMRREEALTKAKELGLDLILITEKANPPVCKIIDYGKYLYQQKKKEKRARASQVKGIRLRFNISIHDMETKVKQARKFLEAGNKVKIELILRGREKALTNYAKEKLEKFLELLKSYIEVDIDQPLKKTPRSLIVIIKKKS